MASMRAHKPRNSGSAGDNKGIALFLVIAAMSVLSLLVTEFTYIAQINQKIAFDALDQVKVHYLAKSAYKLSLLRLKAFQKVKEAVGGIPGAGAAVPKSLIDKIWSFPFFYPIPTNIPGMTMTQKDQIDTFQKESGLDGSFNANITSESGKYNLNLILAPYAPKPAAEKKEKTEQEGGPPAPNPTASPTPFNPDEARQSLGEYLSQVLAQKIEEDPDFASEYRDLRIEDLVDNIVGWADRSYERKNVTGHDPATFKRAPFYTVSELHMVPLINDELYDLFAPTLTASTTPGINVNTMTEAVLRALVPNMTKEEVEAFFKFRDSEEADNTFKTPDDFFKYLGENLNRFRDPKSLDQFKADLTRRNIRIVTEESQFKITVQAKVNQSVRLIEAWVTLGEAPKTSGPRAGAPQGTPPAAQPEGTPGAPKKPADSGLKVTFMRIL